MSVPRNQSRQRPAGGRDRKGGREGGTVGGRGSQDGKREGASVECCQRCSTPDISKRSTSSLVRAVLILAEDLSPLQQLSAQGAFSSRRRRLLHSAVHTFSFSPPPLALATPPFLANKYMYMPGRGAGAPTSQGRGGISPDSRPR